VKRTQRPHTAGMCSLCLPTSSQWHGTDSSHRRVSSGRARRRLVTLVTKRAYVRSSLPTTRGGGAQSRDQWFARYDSCVEHRQATQTSLTETPAGQAEPELSSPFHNFLRPLSEIATLCSITWGTRDRRLRHSCQRRHTGGHESDQVLPNHFSFPPMKMVVTLSDMGRSKQKKKSRRTAQVSALKKMFLG